MNNPTSVILKMAQLQENMKQIKLMQLSFAILQQHATVSQENVRKLEAIQDTYSILQKQMAIGEEHARTVEKCTAEENAKRLDAIQWKISTV
jgi:hypothetical protein